MQRLVAAAAGGSAAATDDGAAFRRWVVALSDTQKNAWLRRAADHPDLALGGELLRTFRAAAKGERGSARRTVGELRSLAAALRTDRENAEVARANKAKAAADAARKRHLTALGRDVDRAWTNLEKLVEASRYDAATTLAVDLRDLATRDGTAGGFADRFEAMRKRQLGRRAFFSRWKRANDSAPKRWW